MIGSTDQAGGDGVVGQSQQCWMETRYIQVSESHRRVSGSQVNRSPGGSSESVGHLGVNGQGQVSGSLGEGGGGGGGYSVGPLWSQLVILGCLT